MARLRPIHWLRTHPTTADALLAILVTGLAIATLFSGDGTNEVRDPGVVAVALAVLANAPIVWRRRNPIEVLAIVALAQASLPLLGYSGNGWAGVALALYSVGSNVGNGRRRTIAVVTFFVLGNALFVVGWLRGDIGLGDLIGADISLPGAYILGDNMRRRRERISDLAERAERAEREQELIAKERVNEERSRIARELHDVVAHSVSVMVIQAGAARRQLSRDPEKAASALEAIETTGRDAMQEMRRILGVLRAEDDEATLAPQPSLDALDELIASDPSLPTELHVRGVRPSLPAGVELSAYRVVQEALTNVRKHAGQCRHVVVVVAYHRRHVQVVVHDDGRGAAQPTRPEPGHGLIGMRERVAACGGELTVGPARGGGWKVSARFPVADAVPV